jgi:cbb3-type cytochrome oxidase subunit 3
MKLMMFLLFLFLFSGCIIFLTSRKKGGARHARASRAVEIADEAEQTFSIFNRTTAAAVLISGSLFTLYCVALWKRSSKTRCRRKTGIRRQIHRG